MVPTCQSLRIFKGALEDEPRHRIDVHGGHLAAQTNRFKGNGAAPGERVQHPGRPSAVGLANLRSKPLQISSVLTAPMENPARRLLLDLLREPAVYPLAPHLLDHTPGHTLQNRASPFRITWVGEKRRDQRSPARRKRPPRRPDVQGRDMPVPHVLLMHGVQRGLLQRKRDLNQAPAVGPDDLSVVNHQTRPHRTLSTQTVRLRRAASSPTRRTVCPATIYQLRTSKDRRTSGRGSEAY